MPGVPSVRNCEACRKAKKKCDQSRPACSRCTRLQLVCIGSGQRRYKFMNEVEVAKVSNNQDRQCQRLSRSPVNETSIIAGAFISKLEVTDLRYDLTVYGTFLKGVPKRIGSNSALDASVTALTAAHSSLYTKQKPSELYVKYGTALKSLRQCLDDPETMQSPDTLCAIYLLLVCESWMDIGTDSNAHGAAIAHLLEAASSQNWHGTFETEMLVTLSVLVIIESFGNPKIHIHPWFDKFMNVYGHDHRQKSRYPSLLLDNLAKVSDYIREPVKHIDGIQSAYELVKADSLKIYELMTTFAEKISSGVKDDSMTSAQLAKVFSDIQVAYSVLLVLTSVLNRLMAIFNPYDETLQEVEEKNYSEIVALTKQASSKRPLGAGWAPLCLIVAWAARPASKREEVVELLAEYQNDFSMAKWVQCAKWLRNRYQDIAIEVAIHDELESNAMIWQIS